MNRRGNSSRLLHSLQALLVLLFILSTILLLYATSFRPTDGAHASASGKLVGHVPALIKHSRLLGPTDPNIPITLLVGFYPRNQADLAAFVSTHTSALFSSTRRYLSTDQFVAMYSPTQANQDAVIVYMQRAGFNVAQTFTHHLLVGFKGTIGLAEKTFQVQINNYRSPEGRQFYAPTTDPTVPTSLATIIQSIVGLDTAGQFKHTPIQAKRPLGLTHKMITPHDSVCGSTLPAYRPNQIATAYNLNGLYFAGLHGEGQTLALFELDDYLPTDISSYISCYGQSTTQISRIAVSGGGSVSLGTGAVEVELDMELVLSAVPQLASLKVYEAADTFTGALAEWSQIVSDNTAPVVSSSWGACEASITSSYAMTENNIFMTAAAQGQSIFAASGDTGSNGCQIRTPPSTTPAVVDPASQPYVTGVGGTTLTLNPNSSYNAETVWNNQDGFHASGGGVSSYWSMPSWQQGPGVINPTYSSGAPCAALSGTYCREVPDVSLDADPMPGYLMYCTAFVSAPCDPNNSWFAVGGTSAAAPMWAAMITLANEKLSHDTNASLTRLGFLNPLLYQIGQNATSYSTDFYDIQIGNNYTTGDGHNEYPATANYDMTTGLGSYNALSLANDLEAVKNPVTPTPSSTTSPTVTPSPTASATASVTPTPGASVTPDPTATASATASADPTVTASATPGSGGPPVSPTWYFAEGKVGAGFTEYITIENPNSATSCLVALQYLLSGGSANPSPITVSIPPATRYTESVNSDLNIAASSSSYQPVSTIVTVTPGNGCTGVVAERPMYFTNFAGVSSGSDVLGATRLGTMFYFADMPTIQDYNTFITILNPPVANLGTTPTPTTGSANILATYYSNGQKIGTQTLQVAPGTRGTLNPTRFFQHVSTKVTSDQPIVVERPSYFSNIREGNANIVSGATSVIGARTPAADWLFAEGYTGGRFQEYLVLANFDPIKDTTATVTLEYAGGHTQKIQVPVAHEGQAIVDVNAANFSPSGSCDTSPCQTSNEVSAEVTAPNNIVAEREMFFQYSPHANFVVVGGTDVTGEAGPAVATAYTFAEGYTNTNYNEWLTLQNPTTSVETITVELVNEAGKSYIQQFQVLAQSRFTIDITGLVSARLAPPGSTFQAYEVSMTVQSTGGAFVAERPIYWNTGSMGTQGGSDVIGYTGK